jgi:hypothetical protein
MPNKKTESEIDMCPDFWVYIRKKNALFVLTKVLNDSDLFFIFLLFF